MRGYDLLRGNELEVALVIFRLNTEFYPEKAFTWNGYALALATKGDTTAAIANYQKSIEVNPQNPNAERMIARLTGK